jgi:4-hydroxy-3-polyprenylbenzoate decarboxylase
VVDKDVDVHNYAEVAWRVLGNVDYDHDVLHTTGPVDHLDHSAYQQFWGGKLGIDATRKLPEEGYTREWPDEIVQDASVVEQVTRRWAEFGIPTAGRERA